MLAPYGVFRQVLNHGTVTVAVTVIVMLSSLPQLDKSKVVGTVTKC